MGSAYTATAFERSRTCLQAWQIYGCLVIYKTLYKNSPAPGYAALLSL